MGLTAIAASYCGHAEIVATLLYGGADATIQNNDKLTPRLDVGKPLIISNIFRRAEKPWKFIT